MRARGVGARTVDEHAAEFVLRLLVLVVRHRLRIRLEVLKLCLRCACNCIRSFLVSGKAVVPT